MAKKKKKKKEYDSQENQATTRPIPGAVALGDPTDKYSDNPSDGLTAIRLARIFKEANAGDVRRQMELFEEMEEKDPHLFSQLQTRKLAVAGLDYEIQPFSSDERDQEIAEFVSEQLSRIENLSDIFIDLLDAIGKGIAIMEIIWGIDRFGRNVIRDIKHVYQKKLVWDAMTDERKIITLEHPEGISIPNNKFVVHRYKAKSGHESRAGLLRVVSWMYLFKNYDVKDWVSFCEVFGMPLRLGKYSPSASEKDKRDLMRAIVELGNDAAGIIPDTAEIEFIEANKSSSLDIYERLADFCDKQMSKAVLGQTLSSDSGGGSYAQGKVHNEVRHDLIVADAVSLAATIRRDIIRPLVEFNFGTDADIPLILFDCGDDEGQKETAETLEILQRMGLKISASYVYKKFRIPKPEDDEEILQLPVSGYPDEKMYKFKESSPEGQQEQNQLDGLVDESNKMMQRIIEKLIEPVIDWVEKAENPKQLLMELKEERNLKKLYQDMDTIELEDMIHQADYIAALIGRTQEDG